MFRMWVLLGLVEGDDSILLKKQWQQPLKYPYRALNGAL